MDAKKIRKSWITVNVIQLIYSAILSLLLMFMGNAQHEKSSFLVIVTIIMFSIGLLGFLILQHCAYKNNGTRFLTFSLCFNCFFCACGIIGLPKHIVMLDIVNIVSTILGMFWCYYSFQLRKLNKKEQLDLVFASPTYSALFEEFRSATNFENLQEKYDENRIKYPEIASPLKRLYKSCKENLHIECAKLKN